MTPLQLVSLLQISDSMFPVGAFAYSDGLETAAAQDLVRDGTGLRDWLYHYIYGVFVSSDGLALAKTVTFYNSANYDEISQVDIELWALKPCASARASSASIGKRLLAAFSAVHECGKLPLLPYGNCAVAYGVVYAACGLAKRDALLAYGYTRLASMVSAALRLIPIGQQESQAVLTAAAAELATAVATVLHSEAEPLRSFSPRRDIVQMNHQYVYSRLFRS